MQSAAPRGSRRNAKCSTLKWADATNRLGCASARVLLDCCRGRAARIDEGAVFHPDSGRVDLGGPLALGLVHQRVGAVDQLGGELPSDATSLRDGAEAEAYDADIDVTACDACGTVLPLHKSGRRKKYCDDRCKMANYRAKNGDALNRVRRQRRAKRRVVAK